jgi:hypothetical protein
MKSSSTVIAAFFLASSVGAFSSSQALRRPATFLASTPDGGDKVAKLRAAAAKARADADRLNLVRCFVFFFITVDYGY